VPLLIENHPYMEIIMHRKVPLLLTFLGTLVPAVPLVAQPPQAGFGFNGVVSGFPTGVVSVTGGGAYDLPPPALSTRRAALAALRTCSRDR
jgi:hypothetical protein